jgi:cobalt-zinc-cadmium efflux system outer membrane protein
MGATAPAEQRTWMMLAAVAALGFLAAPAPAQTLPSPPVPQNPGILPTLPPRASLSFATVEPDAEGVLPLDQLLEMAAGNNPTLSSVRALAQEARGRLVQGGLYPNPVVSWRGNEMATRDAHLGFQGMQIEQQIVTKGKLKLNRAASRHEVAAADWQVVARWYQVMTKVRGAYYEVITARRQIRVARELVAIGEKALAVAENLEKAGAATRPDILRAKVELDQNRVQLNVAQERFHAARRVLAASIGLLELPAAPPGEPVLESLPDYDWGPVLELVLARSADVHTARSLAAQAEVLLRRAEVEVCPNVNLLVRPDYTDFTKQAIISVQVGAPIPLYNRNQGNIFAARAAVARTRQEVRVAELKLAEQVALAIQRYQVARRQVDQYERQIIPNARESLKLVGRGYQSGDPKYDYTAVLQAQRVIAQVELSYVTAFGELWRSVSDLAGLLQQDHPETVGPSR